MWAISVSAPMYIVSCYILYVAEGVIMSLRDLFDACRKGDVARVRKAVADGVDVRNVVNNTYFNSTPLHYACEYASFSSA